MEITIFNHVTDSYGTKVERYSNLSEMYQQFKKCRTALTDNDKKDSAGWVRGILINNQRKKGNLHETRFIIIDVDKSVGKQWCITPPGETHEIMKDLGINHIIHTTWSNRGESGRYRYRLIIPCNRMIDEVEVDLNGREIVNTLNSAGADIEYAIENKSMVQMWFFPSSPDPSEWYESYLYDTGSDYVPKKGHKYEYEKSSEVLEIKPDVCAVSINDIMNGIREHTNIHENMLKLSYQFAKDGVPNEWSYKILNWLLGDPSDNDRVENRRSDIRRMIDSASLKVLEEGSQKIEWRGDRNYKEPPMPPGRLGQMVRMAYSQQNYQNKTIALVSCLGAIGGLAGYKFQCPSTPSMGCNNYYLVSMKTGGGKDFCSKFIMKLYSKSSNDKSYRQFIGDKNFTSGKALRGMLDKKRCCVSVITEMGQVLASHAGDPVSTRRAMLEVYSRSSPDDLVAEERYSKEEDSIKELAHPALTLIGEGEPDGFIKALKGSNSVTDGFAPRCLIFRADTDERPFENVNINDSWDQDILEHVGHLMKECLDDAIPYYMQWESAELLQRVRNHSDKWTRLYNEYDGADHLKCTLATRMHVHCIKLATICAVTNRRRLIVTEEDWLWSEEMVKYCFEDANSFMDTSLVGSGDGSMEDVMSVVKSSFSRLFNGHYKGAEYKLDSYAKSIPNCISAYVFNKIFIKNPAVKRLGVNKSKMGIDILTEYMLNKKYMILSQNATKKYYVISRELIENT